MGFGMHATTTFFSYRSPLGSFGLELTGPKCVRLLLDEIAAPVCSPNHPVAIWLRGYFAGQNLPLPELAAPRTPFQAKLRNALLSIPRGSVVTYADLARELESSPRAVGQALGANPLPILVPCHRVVAKHGLGGFSGGLAWKERLLNFEKASLPADSASAVPLQPSFR